MPERSHRSFRLRSQSSIQTFVDTNAQVLTKLSSSHPSIFVSKYPSTTNNPSKSDILNRDSESLYLISASLSKKAPQRKSRSYSYLCDDNLIPKNNTNIGNKSASENDLNRAFCYSFSKDSSSSCSVINFFEFSPNNPKEKIDNRLTPTINDYNND